MKMSMKHCLEKGKKGNRKEKGGKSACSIKGALRGRHTHRVDPEQQRKRGWNINAGKANCTLYCTLDIHRFIYQLCFKKAGENYICIYIQEKQSFYKENVNSHTLP